jgi:hypothetical protein
MAHCSTLLEPLVNGDLTLRAHGQTYHGSLLSQVELRAMPSNSWLVRWRDWLSDGSLTAGRGSIPAGVGGAEGVAGCWLDSGCLDNAEERVFAAVGDRVAAGGEVVEHAGG